MLWKLVFLPIKNFVITEFNGNGLSVSINRSTDLLHNIFKSVYKISIKEYKNIINIWLYFDILH